MAHLIFIEYPPEFWQGSARGEREARRSEEAGDVGFDVVLNLGFGIWALRAGLM